MQTWIFQGNPKKYDVARAVRSLREDTWLVTKYGTEIQPGDRVYLWESGPDAGIIAVGEVVDEVSERELPDESRPYVLDSLKLGGVQPRVRIRITRLCEPRLKRSKIKQISRLSNLRILKQPQGTNFPVTPQEAAIIEELIAE